MTREELSPLKQALIAIEELKSELDERESEQREPIAILGMACRLPGGAATPESFWALLEAGGDAVTAVPEERWIVGPHAEGAAAPDERRAVRWGAFLTDVDQFDAEFFGLSPREASRMDPQQRLLLEVAWEALERSGQAIDRLEGSSTGVFLGIMTNDYARLSEARPIDAFDAYDTTGNGHCFPAGRLSYNLGIHGPSLAVDTACSSSLVAVHLACQSLRSRESSLALAGGVNLMLSPTTTELFSRTRALSPDGKCRTFDAQANGFVRGEGCGVIVLKRLSDAVASRDPILAVIRGTAVNHDGRAVGLTTPSVLAQRAMLEKALDAAGVAAEEIGLVETHGTGTSLGDPIEAEALASVVGRPRKDGSSCVLGAVKTNIGHLEAAAGVAGLIKVVLCLQNERIPRNLHHRTLNPRISLENTSLVIPTAPVAWRAGERPRFAGVSSFGMSGTNAHAIVGEAPASDAMDLPAAQTSSYLLPLSAHSAPALTALAGRVHDFLGDSASPALRDIAYTASERRAHAEHRLAAVGGSREELRDALAAFARGERHPGVSRGTATRGVKSKIVFVFSGQGSQWARMGWALIQEEEVFAETLERCDVLARKHAGFSVLDVLGAPESSSTLHQTEIAQIVLFATQVALAELWRSWGVVPDAVIGHSVGEVAAAHVAGWLTLEDAVRLVHWRGRLMSEAPAGAMVAVDRSVDDVAPILREHSGNVAVAAVNGPSAIVLSGDAAATAAAAARLARDGIRCRDLGVAYAFHSHLVATAAERLAGVLGRLASDSRAPHLPMYSTVTAAKVSEALDPRYWSRNVRETVLFAGAVEKALDDGYRVFLEVGPHPVLTPHVEHALERRGASGYVMSSWRRGQNERRCLLQALGGLYAAGYPVRFGGLYRGGGRVVVLPAYPFQRRRHWLEQATPVHPSLGASPSGHPLLGVRLSIAGEPSVFESTLDTRATSWLGEHRVFGEAIVPAAAILEVLRAASVSHFGRGRQRIADVELTLPMRLNEESALRLQVLLTPSTGGAAFAAIYSQPRAPNADAGWCLHARAIVEPERREETTSALDLASIEARCRAVVDVDQLYAALDDMGLQYGPAFRGLSEVFRGDGEALGRVRLPAGVSAWSQEDALHPALLDAALQTALAAMGDPVHDAVYIPFRISEFTSFSAAAAAWVHARVEGSSGSDAEFVTGHFAVADDTGNWLARASGVVLRRTTPSAFHGAARAQASTSGLFALRWQAATLAATPVIGGRWVVLADGSALKDALMARLAAAGAQCIPVARREGSAPSREGVLTIDPRDPKAFARLLAEITTPDARLAGVVSLWAAEASEDAEPCVPEHAERLLVEHLHVFQALAALPGPPRVQIVTRGTQPVEAGESVSWRQAPLWGLARVVMQEHPELRCGLVDVDDDARASAEALWRELSQADGESQVAWRRGARYALRLVEAPPPPDATADSPITEASTVVISGGLGALGLRLARWLCEDCRVQRVVLLGRSEPTPEQLSCVQALRASGAVVTTERVDVANAAEVTAMLAALPRDPPLRGIIHAAGVLDDGVLLQQDASRFSKVLAPKVRGAWNLHEATSAFDLDFFVLFSSVASVLGTAGQANYAAANAFLDALAHGRRARGLAAQSLNWGPWAEGGMADRLASAYRERLRRHGLCALSHGEAIALMEQAMRRPEPQLCAMSLDAQRMRQVRAPNNPAPWRAPSRVSRVGDHGASQVAWADEARRLPPDRRAVEVERAVRSDVAKVLASDAEAMPGAKPLRELGLDSLTAIEVRNALSARLDQPLPATLVFSHPSIDALTRHVLERLSSAEAPAPEISPVVPMAARDEPIAIIGVGCRFPGGVRDVEGFWRVLEQGRDIVREVPRERWDADAIYDPDPDAPGKSTCRSGGFLDEIDRFDPDFFGISSREAAKMDPQQRLLLEVTWDALEDAGIPSERLSGSDAGVFVGLMYHEYASLHDGPEQFDGYVSLGSLGSAAAGRISYLLGTNGPSMTIDTACSSSLTAVHVACQHLRNGECSIAVAGGVTVMLTPATYVEFSRLRGLSPDGRCKSFDDAADGVGWSEGCGVLVLKGLSAAERDGDAILAIVRGAAVNHDGRSNGFTAPNAEAQAALVREALRRAGVSPHEVGYVEAHGTGTPLGDPIEAQALGAVFGRDGARRRPLLIGSGKSNFGHTQAAAGAAGLLKAILALQRELIPRTIHVRRPNARVAWDELSIQVAQEAVAWPRSDRPRIAGVSCFGISGTNAHVVLEEAPAVATGTPEVERSAYLVPLSARSRGALVAHARAWSDHLAHPDAPALADVAYTASVRRSHHAHRLAVVGATSAEVAAKLGAFARGDDVPGVVQGEVLNGRAERFKLVFVFPGQGSQWAGMGRELLRDEPVFRESLEAFERLFRSMAGFSLLDEMLASEESTRLDATEVAQPALTAVQIGLTALLRSWGVEPDAVIGHSVGELAAAHAAGALSLDEVVRVVFHRGSAMSRMPSGGAMVQVAASPADVDELLRGGNGGVAIAAINGPRSVTLSGEAAALREVVDQLSQRGIACRDLQVNYAFHSPLVIPSAAAFLEALSSVVCTAPNLPMYSTVTGARVTGVALDAPYWADNVRAPVEFSRAVHGAIDDGCGVFLEVGPHPVLRASLEQCLEERGVRGKVVYAARRGRSERTSVLGALGELYTGGRALDFKRLFPKRGRVVSLPSYPWQRRRCWLEPSTTRGARAGAVWSGAHPSPESDGVSQWSYEVRWSERPVAAAHEDHGVAAGRFLVLADRGGVGEQLASALRARGQACEVVPHDTVLRTGQAFASGVPPSAVVHLGALDLPAGDTLAPEALDAIEHLGGSLLEDLLPLIARCEPAPRLWLITRGAQPVGGNGLSIAQAPVWGLGRVLALEHAECWGGILDLDERRDEGETERLAQAILASSDLEDQAAFRGGRRLVPRLERCALPRAGSVTPVRPDRSYLVTGGLSGLGLEAARWLVRRGAKHLVLMGRTVLPPRERWDEAHPPEQRARIAAVRSLEAHGAVVEASSVDVADIVAVAQLVERLSPPLGGVIHSAGVGWLRPLLGAGAADALREVFRAKVRGAWVLHEVTKRIALDFMVMFSSAAAIWGGMGQGHYAAANHFMDMIAHARHARGLPALGLNLGAVAGGGMLQGDAERLLRSSGLSAMPPDDVMKAMDRAAGAGLVQATLADVDWRVLKPAMEIRRRRPLLDDVAPELVASSDAMSTEVARTSPVADALRASTPTDQRVLLAQFLHAALSDVLQRAPSDVGLETPFLMYGMDSLAAIELRNRIRLRLGLDISATEIWAHARGVDLVELLVERLSPGRGAARAEAAGVAVARHHAAGGTLVIPRPSPEAKVRLLCFPYAGGGAPIFFEWANELPPSIELCAVALPGRHERAAEAVPESVEEMVRGLLPSIISGLDRPFAMFGHCLGAIVMFELARALVERHGRGPIHLFVSGSPPPRKYLLPSLTLQGPERVVEFLRLIGFAAPALLDDREALRELLPPVIGDFDLAASYRYRPTRALDIPVTAFAAKDDPFAPPDLVDEWRAETTAAFSRITYSGEHYFLVPERASITRIVTQDVLCRAAVLEQRALPPDGSLSSAQGAVLSVSETLRHEEGTRSIRDRLSTIGARPGARGLLVCFPCAGGDASAFDGWSDALADIEVCAVDFPGRAAHVREAPFGNVEAMVDWIVPALLKRLDRPFAFFGHDLGAIVMFEVARRLRSAGYRLPRSLFASAAMAPHVYYFPPLHHLAKDRFFENLKTMRIAFGGRGEERLLRADVSAMATYTFRPEPLLDVPIVAFMGDRDDIIPQQGLRAWREQTSASFTLETVPGDHYFFTGGGSPILATINEAFQRE